MLLALAVLLAPAGLGATPPGDLFGGGRLVVYTPRGFRPDPAWRLAPSTLRADVAALRHAGFRAAVTERTTPPLAAVCRFLKRHGIVTVVVGIADPTNAAEVASAIHQRRCADAYAVGDGGLAAKRYGRAALLAAVARVRARTGKPVTVREAAASYRADPTLLEAGDWVFPLVDPASANERASAAACGWTMTVARELLGGLSPAQPLVLAGTGLATGGDQGANEHYQRAYFACLESRAIRFAFEEAVDQPWRTGDPGRAHLGLLRADGTPKLWTAQQIDAAARSAQ